MRRAAPDRMLVMNAGNQYGAAEIASKEARK